MATTKEDKRQPTLADRFLARRFPESDRYVHPRTIDQLKQSCRNAHRFVFDETAAKRIAKVVHDIPDLLVRECQYARAPFDLTWIEYPSWAYWDELNERFDGQLDDGLSGPEGPFGGNPTGDHTVGYLIDHNRINVVSGGLRSDPMHLPAIGLIQFRLNTEWPIEDQVEFAGRIGTSRIGIDKFFWGSSYGSLSSDERSLLRNYSAAEVTPLNPLHQGFEQLDGDAGIRWMADGSIGELRTIIAMLLLLNRPALTRYKASLPNTRGYVRGAGFVPFLSHTTVTIDLDPVPTLRLVGTSADAGVTKRRHEVKGFYRHDHTWRQNSRMVACIHDAVPTDNTWTPLASLPADRSEVRNWLCQGCGGKRWWVDAHERGDASKGYVIKDGYDVTIL